jgi:hypothetical protein
LLRSDDIMVRINPRFSFFGRNKDMTNSNVKANDPQSVEISFVSRRDFFHEKKETCMLVLLKDETQKLSSLSGTEVRGRRSRN